MTADAPAAAKIALIALYLVAHRLPLPPARWQERVMFGVILGVLVF